ncbi:MAG: hypothetical protein ACYC23_22630 [Limisphaerales bacterium]
MSKTRKPRTTNEQVNELFPALARMGEVTKLARKLGQVLKTTPRNTALDAFTALMGRDVVLRHLGIPEVTELEARWASLLPVKPLRPIGTDYSYEDQTVSRDLHSEKRNHDAQG